MKTPILSFCFVLFFLACDAFAKNLPFETFPVDVVPVKMKSGEHTFLWKFTTPTSGEFMYLIGSVMNGSNLRPIPTRSINVEIPDGGRFQAEKLTRFENVHLYVRGDVFSKTDPSERMEFFVYQESSPDGGRKYVIERDQAPPSMIEAELKDYRVHIQETWEFLHSPNGATLKGRQGPNAPYALSWQKKIRNFPGEDEIYQLLTFPGDPTRALAIIAPSVASELFPDEGLALANVYEWTQIDPRGPWTRLETQYSWSDGYASFSLKSGSRKGRVVFNSRQSVRQSQQKQALWTFENELGVKTDDLLPQAPNQDQLIDLAQQQGFRFRQLENVDLFVDFDDVLGKFPRVEAGSECNEILDAWAKRFL